MEKVKTKKTKESKLTKKLRKNPYIAITFVLGLLCIIIIIGNITENKTINKTEDEILCSVIEAIPAWVDVDGKIIHYGALPINQSLMNEVFIPGRIKMLYFPGCSACEAQINYFKEQGTWDTYLKEGLVVNCQEVLK